MKLTIYQKPTCSKCRSALSILKESGVDFEAINYYEARLTADQLRQILKKLSLTAQDILRADEPVAKELGIGKRAFSEDELIALMVSHPDLLQRPIAVKGDQAVLARPPEHIKRLLQG